MRDVADWWLGRIFGVEEETDAAAAPAKTMERAKMRMASFMVSSSGENSGNGNSQYL
jgi:hypothetical protein